MLKYVAVGQPMLDLLRRSIANHNPMTLIRKGSIAHNQTDTLSRIAHMHCFLAASPSR